MKFHALVASDQRCRRRHLSFKTDKIQAILSLCECYSDHELLHNVTVSDTEWQKR
jgi:hypothetical protein